MHWRNHSNLSSYIRSWIICLNYQSYILKHPYIHYFHKKKPQKLNTHLDQIHS